MESRGEDSWTKLNRLVNLLPAAAALIALAGIAWG